MRNFTKLLLLFAIFFPTAVFAQPSTPEYVKIWDTGGQKLDITAASAAKVDGSAVTQPVSGTVSISGTVPISGAGAGDVAHDAVDSGNPVKQGFKAVSADPTVVTTADRANGISDLIGRQVVAPYAIPENFFTSCSAADITGTGSTAVIASAGGSIRYYITAISISNMAAAVATRVDILDGSTVVWSCPAAAAGGGCTVTLPVPLRGTAATAINAQCATTASATRVCVSGYKAVN